MLLLPVYKIQGYDYYYPFSSLLPISLLFQFPSLSPTDIDATRLSVAQSLGATHTVLVETRDSRQLARLIHTTMGCRPDVSMECSGAESSIATCIYVCISLVIPAILVPSFI